MTNKQAIKLLRKDTSPMEIHLLELKGLSYDEVTDKIQEAMELGADAIEKQIAKKSLLYKDKESKIGTKIYDCPRCKTTFLYIAWNDNDYCCACGQRIKLERGGIDE